MDLTDTINFVLDTLFIVIKEDESAIEASTPPLETPFAQIVNIQVEIDHRTDF
jgi:hypothetical protein